MKRNPAVSVFIFKTLFTIFSIFTCRVFYLTHMIIYRCENVNILRIKNTNIIASVFFTLQNICFPINLYSPIFTVFLYPIIMRKKPLIAVYRLKQLLAYYPNLNKYSISFNAHKVLHLRIKNEEDKPFAKWLKIYAPGMNMKRFKGSERRELSTVKGK
jgi:hypothetical protein